MAKNHVREASVEPCCPKCKGTRGYEHEMTETHKMAARWGDVSEAGDSGFYVKFGRVTCSDCGEKFNFTSLEKKGLVGPATDRMAR